LRGRSRAWPGRSRARSSRRRGACWTTTRTTTLRTGTGSSWDRRDWTSWSSWTRTRRTTTTTTGEEAAAGGGSASGAAASAHALAFVARQVHGTAAGLEVSTASLSQFGSAAPVAAYLLAFCSEDNVPVKEEEEDRVEEHRHSSEVAV